MKRLLIILCLMPLMVLGQVQKVAILETVDKEGNIPYAYKLMLRSNLAKAITNAPGYEAYDRTDMDAIMGEQNFQRTGMVSDDQIKRLGQMTGAAFILVAEAVKVDDQNMFITAKILNVETAKTETTDNTLMGVSASDIQHSCESLANKLLGISPATEESRQKEILSKNDKLGWSLAGRSVISLPKPSNDFKAEGRVVVAIIVDAGGKVVSTKATEGTTVTDDRTIQLALKAAYKAVFSKTDSPNKQFGTITYIFKFN